MQNTIETINEKGKNKFFYHVEDKIYTIESLLETNSYMICNIYDRTPHLEEFTLGKFDENLNFVWSDSSEYIIKLINS